MLPPELRRADLEETAVLDDYGRRLDAWFLEYWVRAYLESGQAARDYAIRLAQQRRELVVYGESGDVPLPF